MATPPPVPPTGGAPDPSRSGSRKLPDRPDVRYLKDEAKRRRRAGEFESLSAAQFVVAREHGQASWPGLVHLIEMQNQSTAERAAALVAAACSGDVRKARTLLDADGRLATYDFYAACVTGEADVVASHLARRPSLARAPGGPLAREPILYACFSRFVRADPARAPGVVRIVRMLLDAGADPDAHYDSEYGGERWPQTALYGAAGVANNPELTRMLLSAGADVNELEPEPAPDSYHRLGTEALYHASEFPDATCLRLLLEAKPHARRVSYCLARALDFDHPEAQLLYLEHGADPNFRVPWFHNRTHLHKAVINGRRPEVVAAMLDRGADVSATDARGVTAHGYAVAYGHDELAALLASRGADVSLGADVPPADLLCRAAARGDVAGIRRLLEAGVDVNSPGGDDVMPPLHWACWRGRLGAARELVERGASLTRINCYGADALGTTVHGSENCHDPEGGPSMRPAGEVTHGDYGAVVEMLIRAGAELPGRARGSDAVRAVLLRHGVPEDEEA